MHRRRQHRLRSTAVQPPELSLTSHHPVDLHVGARLRQRRALIGMSQTQVGTAVELTFQQIQKYERGANRISSSRLYEFAKVLDVPVSYFFDEMPSSVLTRRSASGHGGKAAGEPVAKLEGDPLVRRETLEFVRAYYKIRQSGVRKRIFEMVKAVAAGHEKAPDAGKATRARPRDKAPRKG
jgi:transcriptional regulator with XRE-family HTH domain